MTEPAETEDGLAGTATPSLARYQAEALGYYTPGLLRMRLWLTHWQWWMAEEIGVLPAADQSVRSYRRWSIDRVERDLASLRSMLLDATGTEPPVGAHKAAARLTARLGLDVAAGDVEELVGRGALRPFGTWQRHSVYDARVLDRLDQEVVAEVVVGRPRRERERALLRRDQCERLMGLRRTDFAHVVRRGWLVAVDTQKVWSTPANRYLDVPLYRASEVDDLLSGPVDWDAVRERGAVPGARSLLVGDEPAPTREQAATGRALERLQAQYAEEFSVLVAEEMASPPEGGE